MIRLVVLLMMSWLSHAVEFSVYWNPPIIQCQTYGITFKEAHEKFGMIQNTDDALIGDKIAILDHPGDFPHLNGETDKAKWVNGGLPQLGNLKTHLATFNRNVTELITHPRFSGLAIIRFEYWRPIYNQNLDSFEPYQNYSRDNENKTGLTSDRIEILASTEFENHAKTFMMKTLEDAQRYRADAFWAYLGYPDCDNHSERNPGSSCSLKVRDANDRLKWLWQLQNILTPSIEIPSSLPLAKTFDYIAGIINETKRIVKNNDLHVKIIPYITLKYDEIDFINQNKTFLTTMLERIIELGSDGLIIGESSENLKSELRCKNYKTYLSGCFGPALDAALKKEQKPENTTPETSKRQKYEPVMVPLKQKPHNSQPKALPFHIIIFGFCLYFTQIFVTG